MSTCYNISKLVTLRDSVTIILKTYLHVTGSFQNSLKNGEKKSLISQLKRVTCRPHDGLIKVKHGTPKIDGNRVNLKFDLKLHQGWNDYSGWLAWLKKIKCG